VTKLKSLRLAGWKSIRDQSIDFGSITVLVGANGAGKSNVISFFRLLNDMFAKKPSFSAYIGTHGKASGFLHFGTKKTPVMECELKFHAANGEIGYSARWGYAAGDQLVFLEEALSFHKQSFPKPRLESLGAGHAETKLIDAADVGNETARILLGMLRRCRVFHFHDTSETAAVRASCYIDQDKCLAPDASNLAAILYSYSRHYTTEYQRIRSAVRQMVPSFYDFVLETDAHDANRIQLRWVGENSDYEFGAHQLSDGSVRLIALATLLLQPTDRLPLMIALDEPELGLHPAGLALLADMVRIASKSCQVLLATQSALLLDHFDPEDIVIVDNMENVSSFRRLTSEAALDEWLKEYTLSELWERNFVGGGPF